MFFFYVLVMIQKFSNSLMYGFLLFTECDYEQACKDVGALMGRSFSKSNSYSTKGCYLYYNKKYESKIYYGAGGSETENTKKIDSKATKKRPPGFDCSTGLDMFYINLYQIR